MFTRQSFTTHGTTVSVAEHFVNDVFNGDIFEAFFLLFDEVGVFHTAGRIVEHFDAVLVT